MKNLNLYIFVLFVWGLTSCASLKPIRNINTDLDPISRNKLINCVRDSSLKFSALSVNKLSINISDKGKSSNYNGSIRIIKDSAIWISLNAALGIEAARLLLTKDSVAFIDRYHKEYYLGDYTFFEDKLGIDVNYELIEAVLINDLLYYESVVNNKSIKKFDAINTDGYYSLLTMNENKLKRKTRKVERMISSNKISSTFYQNNLINPITFKVNKIFITELYKDWKMNVEYSNYSRVDDRLLAQEIMFAFISDNKDVQCTLSYAKVQFKDMLSIPFNVPSKYDQLVK